MAEQLINSGEMVPVIAITFTFSWLTLMTLGGIGARMFQVYRTTRLKERMLEQGMSVADIERVMNAGGIMHSCSKKRKQGAQPVSDQYLAQTNYNA